MFTSRHPDAIGNGDLNAAFSKRLDITTFGTDADSLDCLYLAFDPIIPAGGLPAVTPHNGTVTVDGNGAGTQVRITLTVETLTASGADAGDVTFTIDCDGSAKVDWASGAAVADSLKDIIDLINEDDAGGTSGNLLSCFKATIGPGGMFDLVCTGAAMFLDDAAESILGAGTTGAKTGVLRRDMAVHTIDSDFLAYWRLAMPEEADRGLFKLLDLYGTIGTDTGATLYVLRDDVSDYETPTGTWATDFANHEIIYQVAAASLPSGPTSATNSMEHNPTFAAAERGPLVVILKGNTDASQTLNLVARMQAVS